MPSDRPKRILCAVRSRPGGEETVQRAIDLALETGARLTFCQVVDIVFLNRLSSKGSARKAATEEMSDMAKFALSIICDQAEEKGVAEVDYLVRTGNVRQALLDLVKETGADVLVLGRPKKMPGRTAFDNQARDNFIQELEAAGVTVEA